MYSRFLWLHVDTRALEQNRLRVSILIACQQARCIKGELAMPTARGQSLSTREKLSEYHE